MSSDFEIELEDSRRQLNMVPAGAYFTGWVKTPYATNDAEKARAIATAEVFLSDARKLALERKQSSGYEAQIFSTQSVSTVNSAQRMLEFAGSFNEFYRGKVNEIFKLL